MNFVVIAMAILITACTNAEFSGGSNAETNETAQNPNGFTGALRESNTYETLPRMENLTTQIPSRSIRAICHSKGYTYIANASGISVSSHSNMSSWKTFTTRHGLISLEIEAIACEGPLAFISYNNGFTVLNLLKQKKFERISLNGRSPVISKGRFYYLTDWAVWLLNSNKRGSRVILDLNGRSARNLISSDGAIYLSTEYSVLRRIGNRPFTEIFRSNSAISKSAISDGHLYAVTGSLLKIVDLHSGEEKTPPIVDASKIRSLFSYPGGVGWTHRHQEQEQFSESIFLFDRLSQTFREIETTNISATNGYLAPVALSNGDILFSRGKALWLHSRGEWEKFKPISVWKCPSVRRAQESSSGLLHVLTQCDFKVSDTSSSQGHGWSDVSETYGIGKSVWEESFGSTSSIADFELIENELLLAVNYPERGALFKIRKSSPQLELLFESDSKFNKIIAMGDRILVDTFNSTRLIDHSGNILSDSLHPVHQIAHDLAVSEDFRTAAIATYDRLKFMRRSGDIQTLFLKDLGIPLGQLKDIQFVSLEGRNALLIVTGIAVYLRGEDGELEQLFGDGIQEFHGVARVRGDVIAVAGDRGIEFYNLAKRSTVGFHTSSLGISSLKIDGMFVSPPLNQFHIWNAFGVQAYMGKLVFL